MARVGQHGGAYIEGLAEFRRDLRRAAVAVPRKLPLALRAAGKPLLKDLEGIPARRSGDLAAGYRVRVRGANADLTNVEPYAGGADWGQRGKWSGFQKYGGPGRFAARVVVERAELIAELVYAGLRDVFTAYGWFRGAL
jgi:hypothetical protein